MSAGNVLIVCGKSEVAGSMESTLIKEGCYPVSCAHSANEARRQFINTQPDLIIISAPLPDEQGIDLVLDIREKTEAGIIVMARPDQIAIMQGALESTGAMILPKPINRLTLTQSARFALSVRNSLFELKNERDSLKKRMDERKLVEKAKWLLVEKANMSEPEAFRTIQKQAMDLRLPQLQVAEVIIKEYE
ncbi:response regulator with putative antiterminator output domain [Desulfitobacterium dichloroeliminans LMG P-21439]|uniref:Stage 0 sporulation protein A homolog n=1 Tax=Desulfitobacterium dichloroeliminans (strain LMG P-21439 / DCA1) TaxID=871963 RepID=L0F565_DESDL|nr:ANTAR domain-containing protein [Desulfitobacterium dichloroeliminans]AGA68332.1 response regulator with putative antiterminator output domain [Desulfitobacterium dichloroeliminans LMG P-21439]